ncbi:MAG: penicillin-insensitive murein endopeptidase [Myxococcales bacterium]|nr:penicillin-insensitive murein endopeptidase [Myxococcales bacterium]
MPTGCVALLVTLGIGPVLEPALDEPEQVVDLVPDDSIPTVTSLDEVLAAAPPTVIPERPARIRHRVLPRERVSQIAIRYGVEREDLLRWNKRLDPQAVYPEQRSLEVRARRLPPPRMKVRYVVQEGEGWMDVSAKFRIAHRDLHAYNWRVSELTPGKAITLWVDPGWPQTIHPDQGPPVPEHFEVTPGGRSVGRPNRGRLQDGVMLPESDLYTRKPQTSGLYGSSHTIEQIQRAFAIFRHDSGFAGEVVIGAISRRRGGRFVPHLSHQSGRDIDIRLPLWPGVEATGSPLVDEIDWLAAWELVEAFIETGEVAAIFLDVHRHRHLYEAARAMGETPESLEEVIPWPRFVPDTRPVIRHSPGHDTHIHVRIKCGPDEPRCKRR